jgi:hypothetical protein
MTIRKTISVMVIAVAYFASAYVNTIVSFLPPPVPAVQTVGRPGRHSQKVPRPSWVPRRHLPLVKLASLDQLALAIHTTGRDPDDYRLPVVPPPPTTLVLPGLPSHGRAPPAA